MQTMTIIVPCYNEEEALPYFYEEISKIRQQLTEISLKLLFINDGSTDNTLAILKKLASSDSSVYYISFSRNFGKEAAMYAGFQYAGGDYIATMDADLQDPPDLLPELYHAVAVEGYDSAATRRVTRRGEPPVRSFFAHMFYRLINRMSNVDIVDGARDFRFMNRKFVNALLELKEYNRFSKGLFGWVGFKTKWIEFENVKRVAGETKWSFWKLFKYSIEGMVAFTTTPLVVASFAGFFLCLLSFIATIFIVVRKLLMGDPVPGWPSLACIITFLSGILLFFMGILGQYMAKMYLEIKDRPIYLVDKTNMEKKNDVD